jgi:hypothetical protein
MCRQLFKKSFLKQFIPIVFHIVSIYVYVMLAMSIRYEMRLMLSLKFVHFSVYRSARQTAILSRKLESSDSASTNLKKYCETRWVERHDIVSLFCESITETIQALENLIEAKEVDSGKAQQLHHSLCNFSFLIALFIAQRMLSLTRALSKNLQSVDIDLYSALASLEITTTTISEIREHAEDEFSTIYSKVYTTAALFGVEPSMLRLADTQRHR